ncbi:hypothetical protein A1O7_09633 [Cladophialophora yegresii CBS 114405]|uniref:Aminoglycoside phosphotransferase domain-containing protein n=1 Tax=Cladophialophora yegresii CBS 114405 TaxID=1182544 RepID=W9VMQ1_9EURO|nr:uncharacterized protein A1O7_09633 [Cladophialophora yegresii CBS 114405]EXJ54295.1 hypothetical protein A1O7_09633 [Cladophialophora yegresii CBS 114405]
MRDLEFPISMPYFAPAAILPAKLPSTAEIESSQEILTERTAAKVVALGPHFVAKYGKGIDLEEGQTMIFVKQRAQVPVPTVYALYHEDGKNVIIMERIHGQTMEERWPTLTNAEKNLVATQLKECLRRMRSIMLMNGDGYGYSSLNGKPLRDSLFLTCTANRDGSLRYEYEGPFKTEADLNDAIIRKCKASEAMRGKAMFYENALHDVFCTHPPVLTHGDLQRKNIMVRMGSQGEVAITILDWEIAGWYPSYWEYAQAIVACGLFEDDWHHYVDRFLDPYRNEYAWLHMLQNELW